jgi:hypothetical protein
MCADKKKKLQERRIKLNTFLKFSTLTNPPTMIEQRKQFNAYDNTPQETKSNTVYVGSPCMFPMQGKHKLHSPL